MANSLYVPNSYLKGKKTRHNRAKEHPNIITAQKSPRMPIPVTIKQLSPSDVITPLKGESLTLDIDVVNEHLSNMKNPDSSQ